MKRKEKVLRYIPDSRNFDRIMIAITTLQANSLTPRKEK